jgi:hypothetical protein
MATLRKRFFTVECSLYREPWPREVKLALVMLGMHMADRWAADRLTPKQATVAHLAIGDLLNITGAETRDEAHAILRELATNVTIKVQPLENGFTRIEWPKLAKTQWSQARNSGSIQGKSRARSRPKVSPAFAPSYPHPHPHLKESEEAEEERTTEDPTGLPTCVAADGDRPTDPPYWEPMIPLLTTPKAIHPPAESDEREAWIDAFGPEIEASAEAEAQRDGITKAAAFKRILLPRWRTYLTGERRFRGAGEVARVRAKMAQLEEENRAGYEAELAASKGVM